MSLFGTKVKSINLKERKCVRKKNKQFPNELQKKSPVTSEQRGLPQLNTVVDLNTQSMIAGKSLLNNGLRKINVCTSVLQMFAR